MEMFDHSPKKHLMGDTPCLACAITSTLQLQLAGERRSPWASLTADSADLHQARPHLQTPEPPNEQERTCVWAVRM
jgi:hypothetical protein